LSALEVFHQTGTVVFALGSLFVAGRLLWLGHRSSAWPEWFLGLGIGSSVLGYGLMVASMAIRGPDATGPSTAGVAWLNGAGTAIHHLGVATSLLFVLSVFRQTDRWARVLFAVLMVSLWAGFVSQVVINGFRTPMVGHPAWLMQYTVVWVYPLWSTVESFRYYKMMGRRRALGLADPLVVNRFFLWGLASLMTGATIWVASITFAIMDQPALLVRFTPPIRVTTAAIGLITIACYALTFFPPARYAAWLRGDWRLGQNET
jgi:hypothetical protein